jgi:glucokinase
MTDAGSLIVGDIGGTHARFAIATPQPDGLPVLADITTIPTAAHPSLASAYAAFSARISAPLPPHAVLAVACPVEGELLQFTNNPWSIRPAALAVDLGLDSVRLINDFEAVAHAVAHAGPGNLAPVCGPAVGLPTRGVTSIIGPGTGLGVAMLIREGGLQAVFPTEASHIGFAAADGIEDVLLTAVRRELHGRVSVERLVSGPGLAAIHLAMGGAPAENQKALWTEVLTSDSSEARCTLERFLAMLGGFAGDMALAHGARAVVIAGGLGARIGDRLAHPAFVERFCDKGRFRQHMQGITVLRLLLEEPGLLGAAVA